MGSQDTFQQLFHLPGYTSASATEDLLSSGWELKGDLPFHTAKQIPFPDHPNQSSLLKDRVRVQAI